jgi:hypothetical protein
MGVKNSKDFSPHGLVLNDGTNRNFAGFNPEYVAYHNAYYNYPNYLTPHLTPQSQLLNQNTHELRSNQNNESQNSNNNEENNHPASKAKLLKQQQQQQQQQKVGKNEIKEKSDQNSQRNNSKNEEPVSKSKLLQELLECPICMNLYENPHVLPCQHTFCKSCLVSLQSNRTNSVLNSSIDCPICRESHKLPKGVDGLTANYTMKRLIELESMIREKEKEKPNQEKAKCFICQKYAHLSKCVDCSYMLCKDCQEYPNHDLIIESKIRSRVKQLDSSLKQPHYGPTQNRATSSQYVPDTASNIYNSDNLKLTLLCHSSAVELRHETIRNDLDQNAIIQDEFGKCKTFSKVAVSMFDRVITLKKIVEAKYGISTKHQILVYKDNILKSDLKTLNAYNVRQFSRIHVFDARDLKENVNEVEENLYGIYQDAELFEQANLNSSSDSSLEFKEIDSPRKNVISSLRSQNSSPACEFSSTSQTEFSYEPYVENTACMERSRRKKNYRTAAVDSSARFYKQADEYSDTYRPLNRRTLNRRGSISTKEYYNNSEDREHEFYATCAYRSRDLKR